MAQSQVNLSELGQTIAKAYDSSINLTFDQETRLGFQVTADRLSQQFDQLSGRWFQDQSVAFTKAGAGLKSALNAMEAPITSVTEATAALKLLTTLAKLFDSLLSVLG